MSQGHKIRSYDYVNHPYETVRDGLSADPRSVFQAAAPEPSAGGRCHHWGVSRPLFIQWRWQVPFTRRGYGPVTCENNCCVLETALASMSIDGGIKSAHGV